MSEGFILAPSKALSTSRSARVISALVADSNSARVNGKMTRLGPVTWTWICDWAVSCFLYSSGVLLNA